MKPDLDLIVLGSVFFAASLLLFAALLFIYA